MFDSEVDRYDPARHQVAPTISPGARLRNVFSTDAHVMRQEATVPAPNPRAYWDKNTDTRNQTLTPGGMGQVRGYRLKFDESDESQGIFLIDADDVVTKVDVIGRNMPSELMFMVPAGWMPAITLWKCGRRLATRSAPAGWMPRSSWPSWRVVQPVVRSDGRPQRWTLTREARGYGESIPRPRVSSRFAGRGSLAA